MEHACVRVVAPKQISSQIRRRHQKPSHYYKVQAGRGRRFCYRSLATRADSIARIIPADILELELTGANRHELDTLRLLQARLPDTYTGFHGFHWTREFPGETPDSESSTSS